MDPKTVAVINKVLPVIDKLPKPEPVYNPEFDDNKVRCAGCSVWKDVQDFKITDTPVVKGITIPLCESCAPEYKGLSNIVCCTCKVVVGWMKPHKEKLGFVFAPDAYYHIKECPVCKEDLQKADILEKLIYFKDNNIPFD